MGFAGTRAEGEILAERARALARRPEASPSAAVVELLVFAAGGEWYGLPTAAARRVARFRELTPLPGASKHLLGVISLRGEILPVFDLRPLLGRSAGRPTDLCRVLVLGAQRDELALLADEVREVRQVATSEILEVPAPLAGLGGRLLRGVTKDAVILLDGAALLSDPRLSGRNEHAPGA